jgi:hypothetical protein
MSKGLDAVDKFNNSPTEALTVCMNKDTTVFCLIHLDFQHPFPLSKIRANNVDLN